MAFSRTDSAFATASASYINTLLEGVSWTGTISRAASITYTFDISHEGGHLLNSGERAAATGAMQAWMNVANVTFTPASVNDADLTFSQHNLGYGTAGLTSSFFSGATYASSEVQVDDEYSIFTPGTFGYLIFLHEIGHALGLKHPGDYGAGDSGPFLSAAEDNLDYTIMSYNDGMIAQNLSTIPITPMVYDIAAMQYLYGANTGYNNGESTYAFNGSAAQSMTIWDGGGNDYINISSYGGGAWVDLREGTGAVSHIGSTYVWIAYGATIENATGGGGADTLLGNALDNRLAGREGGDVIRGAAGNDVIMGANATGTLADGNDFLYGGIGQDTLQGNAGNDLIYGGSGTGDTLDGPDLIYGGSGNDSLYGNAGNDTIYGGIGNDAFFGGLGNDTFVFTAGAGIDTIGWFDNPGALAGDRIQIAPGINGLAISSASDVLSHITYANNEAVIDLGGGNALHVQNLPPGSLTADDFLIA